MSDDLLQQADQLMMRRRRVFVADGADTPPPNPSDDDVPVLTDVVPLDGAGSAPSERFRAAIAGELEAWLDQELPGHILHVLDGLADQLIMQVGSRARTELLPRLLAALDTAPIRSDRDDTGG
jgi:hypothetical protein